MPAWTNITTAPSRVLHLRRDVALSMMMRVSWTGGAWSVRIHLRLCEHVPGIICGAHGGEHVHQANLCEFRRIGIYFQVLTAITTCKHRRKTLRRTSPFCWCSPRRPGKHEICSYNLEQPCFDSSRPTTATESPSCFLCRKMWVALPITAHMHFA